MLSGQAIRAVTFGVSSIDGTATSDEGELM